MTYEHRTRDADRRRMIDGLERLTNENQRLRRQLAQAMRISSDALDVWHDEYHDGDDVEHCESTSGHCAAWCTLRDEIAADDAARKAGR